MKITLYLNWIKVKNYYACIGNLDGIASDDSKIINIALLFENYHSTPLLLHLIGMLRIHEVYGT